MAFMDLTGRFPKRSRSGNEYILIAYHYDGNVLAEGGSDTVDTLLWYFTGRNGPCRGSAT